MWDDTVVRYLGRDRQGELALGETHFPKSNSYYEYDFLSNVSIRHVLAIYIGLTGPRSANAWGIRWIKIVPQLRQVHGAYTSFAVSFVNVRRKIPQEIFERTGKWPTQELKNLWFRKEIGVFDFAGKQALSSQLTAADRAYLKPLFDVIARISLASY